MRGDYAERRMGVSRGSADTFCTVPRPFPPEPLEHPLDTKLITSRTPHRQGGRRLAGAIAVLALATLLPLTAALAQPGNGRGGPKSAAVPAGTCWADGDHVYASGLPTYEVLNFLVTDSSGTDGWVLGENWDGTDMVKVPARTETTTYEFISVQKGKDGKNYDVYARCTAGA